MKVRILVSSYHMNQVLDKYSDLFHKHKIYTDTIIKNPIVKEAELLPIISNYDGVICSDDQFTAKVLRKANKLKVISKWGTGLDSIDTKVAHEQGIKVYNSPGAFSESVSLYVWGMIIALTRKLLLIDSLVRNNSWKKAEGMTLAGKTIGVIGAGNIGKSVIGTGIGFQMRVLINDIKKIDKTFLNKYKASQVSKSTLLKESDIVVLCVDLNQTSYHLISSSELKKMKKGSYIINISRGPVIDEKALIIALCNDIIAGAGLDVFEKEPLQKNSKLRKLKNCIISSHNAYNTFESVKYVHDNTVNNLLKGLGFIS